MKEVTTKVEDQKKKLANSSLQIEKLMKESEMYKTQFLELQRIYILINRINELEDYKKALIDQLKSMGVQSRAHYVHRRLDKP